MRMAAGPGPGFPDTRADGSGPFDARALAGRAWLAAAPDELAAQRRVMADLAAGELVTPEYDGLPAKSQVVSAAVSSDGPASG
jgi:hypothetical protein